MILQVLSEAVKMRGQREEPLQTAVLTALSKEPMTNHALQIMVKTGFYQLKKALDSLLDQSLISFTEVKSRGRSGGHTRLYSLNVPREPFVKIVREHFLPPLKQMNVEAVSKPHLSENKLHELNLQNELKEVEDEIRAMQRAKDIVFDIIATAEERLVSRKRSILQRMGQPVWAVNRDSKK